MGQTSANPTMDSDSTSAPFAGKRIGLVLTGGGGKGAYEIGVWRGLAEKGITQFRAISGTSIGGLNGYLVARGNLEDAETLWRKLGLASPLQISFLRLAFGLLERIGIAIILAITTYVLLPFVGFIGVVAVCLPLFLALHFEGLRPTRALLPMLAIFLILLVKRVLRRTRIGRTVRRQHSPYSDRDHRRFLLFTFQPWMHHLFALAGLVGLPLWMLWRDVVWQHKSLHWFWLFLVLLVIGLGTIYLSIDKGLSSISQIPLFGAESLERELQQLLRRDQQADEHGVLRLKIKPYCYVTRLVERPISLPDLNPGAARRVNRTVTALGMEYVSLGGADVETARSVLSSTGAIAGFLPRVVAQKGMTSFRVSDLPRIYYDAGFIDNTPVSPLLEWDLCDVLIVVLLNNKIKNPTAYLQRYMDSVNWRIRKANPDIPDDVWNALSGFRDVYPSMSGSDKLIDVQLITILPSRSLGGFLTGTLRFNSGRIEEDMKLGRSDAHAAIDKALQG